MSLSQRHRRAVERVDEDLRLGRSSLMTTRWRGGLEQGPGAVSIEVAMKMDMSFVKHVTLEHQSGAGLLDFAIEVTYQIRSALALLSPRLLGRSTAAKSVAKHSKRARPTRISVLCSHQSCKRYFRSVPSYRT